LEVLVDDKAALAAVVGVLIGLVIGLELGAGDINRSNKRRWWSASALCALGIFWELSIVTEGNHSQVEHSVVFAVQLLLLAYFLVVSRAGRLVSRPLRDPW
jgi:hypothetical protein